MKPTPLDQITGRPENSEWPKEYVWTCSLCGECAHGEMSLVKTRRSEHEALSGHKVSFLRYPDENGVK
jgi:hypothetical protein